MKKNTRKSKQPTTSFWKSWKFLVLIAGGVFVLAVMLISYNQPSQPVTQTALPTSTPGGMEMIIKDKEGKILVRSTEAEGLKLINDLFAAVNPGLPENSYMTPFMKEKINWVYNGIAAKTIKLETYPYYAQNSDGTSNDSTLMQSNYVSVSGDGKPPYTPILMLFAPRLIAYVYIQQKSVTGSFSQFTKNTFALMLVHEAVHLEHPAEFFLSPRTHDEIVEEENRAWYKVDVNATRQLRQEGQPLDTDWIEANDILKRCGDKRHCPEFISFITGSNDFQPHSPK